VFVTQSVFFFGNGSVLLDGKSFDFHARAVRSGR